MNSRGTPLVEMRDIQLAFGGIQAVDHVTVDLYPGEVVGLLGHNGAGKSTLIKCLSGAYQADAGEIFVNGEKATSRERISALILEAMGDRGFEAEVGGTKRRGVAAGSGPDDHHVAVDVGRRRRLAGG